MKENERKARRGSLIGPVILIGLGTVFLLNNLGVLPWSVWEMILRLWPVLLIAAGLDLLIGRRSALGSVLALALTLAALAGVLWLFGAGIVPGQASSTEEIKQALDGATQAEIIIAPANGTLHVGSLMDSANLVEGLIHLGSGERVGREFAVEDGTATFIRESEGGVGPFFGGWGDERDWDLGLNPGVPLWLEISLGVGQSEIDLTDLMVSDLGVSMGIGQTIVILPDGGRFQARIDGAIGETVVVIPAGLAARIRVDTALGSSHVPDDYRRRGDVYVSPGYESADNRVDLEVSQAIGNISIRHSGGG